MCGVLKSRERARCVRSGLGEEDRKIIVRARADNSMDLVMNGVRPGEGVEVLGRLGVGKGGKKVRRFGPGQRSGKGGSRSAVRVTFGR